MSCYNAGMMKNLIPALFAALVMAGCSQSPKDGDALQSQGKQGGCCSSKVNVTVGAKKEACCDEDAPAGTVKKECCKDGAKCEHSKAKP